MRRAPAHARRRSRTLSALVATTLTAGLVGVTAPPASAAVDTLSFTHTGSATASYGANAAVYIDGRIRFDSACSFAATPGIDDFVYPATDVYLVQSGSAAPGAKLQDAAGGDPNTVVAVSSGIFLDELVAVTGPGGKLAQGVYDVVYDTCQDGHVTAGDPVFPAAVTVEVPAGDLPPLSDSLARIKDAARLDYLAWLKTHTALTALFKLDDAKELAACLLAPSPGCLVDVLAVIRDVDSTMAQSSDFIEGLTLGLVMNRAKNYGAIWQDPPDPQFSAPTTLAPLEAVPALPATGAPIADALSSALAPLAQEGALAEALLHAVERYQGAQAAGDAAAALLQARAVRDLSATLRDHLDGTTAVTELRDAVRADRAALDAQAQQGHAVLERVGGQGFTSSERRTLLNRGMTTRDVAALEGALARARTHDPAGADDLLAALDDVVAARSETVSALDATAQDWSTLVHGLELRSGGAAAPVADAGGPYSAVDAQDVRLDGSASTTPAGDAIASYDWDLDGDAAFDDASGPQVPLEGGPSRTVGLRVTDTSGRWAVDYAAVRVDGADRAPVLSGATPTNAVTTTVGTPLDLTVQATDPDGDALSYDWTVGGEPAAADGPTLRLAAEHVGEQVVTVVVTGAERSATRSWSVSVLAADGDGDGWTATSDCDDTRADTRPGAIEKLGNERDDDCDAGTPDAPPGGLTGQLWLWGSAGEIPAPLASTSLPVPYLPFGDHVRAVESGKGQGFAVLADGTVRGWGAYRGNGSAGYDRTPAEVSGVGGEGRLSGVVEVTGDYRAVLALRSDGSVVAWGENGAKTVGDGTDVVSRTFPVPVVDAGGRPLTGVASIETGEGVSFALMEDGRLQTWGHDWCTGAGLPTGRNHAAVNPLYGDDVVQVASGDGGMALVRKADGSVWSCGGDYAYTGRGGPYVKTTVPGQLVGLGPGSDAVDVAYGDSSGVVLTGDGTVWTWGKNLNSTLDVLGIPWGATQWAPAKVPLPPGPPVVDVEVDDAATTFALRADGSVLVWGASVFGSAGIGGPATSQEAVVGTPTVALGGGQALALANSVHGSLAVVRPAGAPDVDRPLPWVRASVSDATISESSGGTVRVALSQPAPDELALTWQLGSAEPVTTTVPRGAAAVDVPVAVQDDALDEDDQALAFSVLSLSHGVQLDRRTAVVTVQDDDAPPALRVLDTEVPEGGTSLTDAHVEVVLDAVSGKDVSVRWTAVDGTATAPSDYTAATGVLLLPAGSTRGVVHVPVRGDGDVEPHEALTVELSEPGSAVLGDGSAAVLLKDDEPLLVDVDAPTVQEGDDGTTAAPFEVSMTEPPAGVTVRLPYELVGGTAQVPADVQPAAGTLELTDGSPRTVVTQVVADREAEPLGEEVFTLRFGAAESSDGRPIVLADAGRAVVVDDDADPSPAPDAGPPVDGLEGSALPLSGTAAPGVATTWSVDDPLCTVADPGSAVSTVTCADETTATATLTAANGTSDTVAVVVTNAPPTVELAAPADGSAVRVGEPVTLAVEMADAGTTDVLVCTVDWGDGTEGPCDTSHAFGAPGQRQVTVRVDDGDSGLATTSVTLLVAASPWPFLGFFAPVDNAPVVNTVKAGSTVPVKFSLGGDRGPGIFADGYPASSRSTCGAGPTDALEETATPGASRLTYDAATDRYHYNWQTEKGWAGTCRRLTLRFADGSVRTADFRFR